MVKKPRGPRSKTIVAMTTRSVFSFADLMAICASSNTICVSIITASAPPDSSAVICSVKTSYRSASDAFPSGSMNSPVGPTDPATN